MLPILYLFSPLFQAPGALQATVESDAKAPEGKDRTTNKKSKGSSENPGLSASKAVENGKAASGSGNDAATQR